MRLDLSQGRQKMVGALKEIANRRMELIRHVDIKELWEVLNTEQVWIDLATMTEFCFPNSPTEDHESAVVRAFFENRFYFKFNPDRFFPNSEEQVDRLVTQEKETARKNRTIQESADWLKSILNNNYDASEPLSEDKQEFADILKSAYLFEIFNPLCAITPIPRHSASYAVKTSFIICFALRLPRAVATLLYWISTFNSRFLI